MTIHNAALVARALVQHDPGMQLSPFRSKPDLRQRLAERLPDLLGLTLEQVTSEVPFYQHLTQDHMDSDVAQVTAQNLLLFVRLLLEDQLPERSDFELMMRSAASRAEERIPLQDVLAAYYAGFRACWDQLLEVIGPGDGQAVVEIGNLVLVYLRVVTIAVTESYVETTTALSGREREARAELLSLVLDANDAPEDWQEAGLSPWTERTVISLRLSPPRHGDQLRAQVDVRRRASAVRDVLGELSGAEVLDSLGPSGGTIVARGRISPAALGEALGTALRGRWYAGLATAELGEETLEALQAATECAEVADRLRRTPGVHVLRDLLLEVQVTRPGPARSALLAVLTPLDAHPELTETLIAYVAAAGRRADTSRQLHIHANTLDYRLRRVQDLTGVDASTREGGELIHAALLVRQFVSREPRGRAR